MHCGTLRSEMEGGSHKKKSLSYNDCEHLFWYKANNPRNEIFAVKPFVIEVGGKGSMQTSDFTIMPVLVGFTLSS